MMTDVTGFAGNSLPGDDEDRFGFGAVADRVSSAIVDQTGGACVVVGLEGEWGSGKSSLLEMIGRRLSQAEVGIVRFAPWMVGSRDTLIAELLVGINAAVEGMGGKVATPVLSSISAKLRSYAGGASLLGRFATAAGAVGVPIVGAAGTALSKASEAMEKGFGDRPLSRLKQDSSEALRELDRRIVVLIDDIDRLEPKDAVEVLRLVQSVADFPNVTYVICYDQARLAEGIREITGVTDGSAYLEKIVQVVQPVPRPQPSALRRMFRDGLRAITGRDEEGRRLAKIVVDHVGYGLRTPRAVVRALDALRLLWPALGGKVDLADLVWLQFVRARDVELYRWMENYVGEAADASVDGEGVDAVRATLVAGFQALPSPRPACLAWRDVSPMLPLSSTDGSPSENRVLVRPSRSEALELRRDRRLASPEHSRLYFGLLPPEGAMSDSELDRFLDLCRQPTLLARRMLELAVSPLQSGVSKFEVILDQLAPIVPQLDDGQVRGFLIGLLSDVDHLTSVIHVETADARQVLGRLLLALSEGRDGGDWADWMREALPGANAVAFLTEQIQIEHGEIGLAWAGDALGHILGYLAGRYADFDRARLIKHEDLLRVIEIWRAGDPDGAEAFLKEVLADDSLLKIFLTTLYPRMTEIVGLEETGRLIFGAAIRKYFDVDVLRSRVLDIESAASGAEKKILSAVVTAIEETRT